MSDILDLIDSALADGVSPDAMRWCPDAPRAPQPEVPDLETALRQFRMLIDDLRASCRNLHG